MGYSKTNIPVEHLENVLDNAYPVVQNDCDYINRAREKDPSRAADRYLNIEEHVENKRKGGA